MKVEIGNNTGSYTFNATGKTITFAGISLTIDQLLLVTNSTDQTIIYNFANPSMGGSMSGQTLTLLYNTSSMSNTDKLQIFAEIPEPHIDFDIGAMKTVGLSNVWDRYTDYETLVSAQNLTNAYADYGAEIDMRGYTHLGLFMVVDANDSSDASLKLLGKHTPAGTEEFTIDTISDTVLWTGKTSDYNKYYSFNVETIPYVQLQAKHTTLNPTGGTTGDLTIYINKMWRS